MKKTSQYVDVIKLSKRKIEDVFEKYRININVKHTSFSFSIIRSKLHIIYYILKIEYTLLFQQRQKLWNRL